MCDTNLKLMKLADELYRSALFFNRIMDGKKLVDDKGDLLFSKRELDEKIDRQYLIALEEVKESYRKQLLSLCEDQNCSGQGLRVMKMIMRGRVAYDEIPEIKGVDLDKYRKASVSTWKIMVA